jgi:hypothetical protein
MMGHVDRVIDNPRGGRRSRRPTTPRSRARHGRRRDQAPDAKRGDELLAGSSRTPPTTRRALLPTRSPRSVPAAADRAAADATDSPRRTSASRRSSSNIARRCSVLSTLRRSSPSQVHEGLLSHCTQAHDVEGGARDQQVGRASAVVDGGALRRTRGLGHHAHEVMRSLKSLANSDVGIEERRRGQSSARDSSTAPSTSQR